MTLFRHPSHFSQLEMLENAQRSRGKRQLRLGLRFDLALARLRRSASNSLGARCLLRGLHVKLGDETSLLGSLGMGGGVFGEWQKFIIHLFTSCHYKSK